MYVKEYVLIPRNVYSSLTKHETSLNNGSINSQDYTSEEQKKTVSHNVNKINLFTEKEVCDDKEACLESKEKEVCDNKEGCFEKKDKSNTDVLNEPKSDKTNVKKKLSSGKVVKNKRLSGSNKRIQKQQKSFHWVAYA